MARPPRPVRPLPLLLLFAVTVPLFGDQQSPSADDVRKLQSLYRAERTQAAESGAVRVVSDKQTRLADDLAAQANAALEAGRLDEAARKFRDARWHLPGLPPNLPPHVARVFGSS